MKLILTPIHKKLNKAFLKQDLNREQIETFKANLKILFSKSKIAENKKEHEEHFKNIVSDFLKDTYYKNHYEININKRKDLVIHNGKSSSDSVGVIIEAKKPSNESEMISQKTPNAKALHELLHYYMQERFINDNKELKHIIATNSYDWYIFDAADFEKFFYENKKIRKNYENWNNGVLVGSNTNWFYNEVAKPYIDKELTELEAVHFNLLDYKEIIENTAIEDDDNLVNLYKILSPEHLLKKPFANDSNTLNKAFYNELLHIIGLEEKPDGGKKLIERKGKNRDDGSLLENTINILKTHDKLKSIDNPEHFGESEDDQIYSIGLELCITWLNRILFLKLLEGQLIKYHNGNPSYTFINSKKISDFDELDELFFEVLAVKANERTKSVSDKYGNIPYLNSSLFEISELESKTIQISALKHRLELSIYPHSVLKNKEKNKTLEAKNTLHYLFEFLDAYNFSSDSSAKIQENNKTIINASVLGLIFEKINGYKDGSFFTPGFITMYMCRETIRRAVAQKFKELENPEIETFEEVKTYCARYFKKEDLTRFNRHIDSLKICDPAVGSGHFLVSALNEMIAIKSELNILTDHDGTPLEYEITVDNDELTILNKKTNKPFEYLLGADQKPPKSLQQVQVTLFSEKQKIIENCLFGVDINPKSVLICRLRLWIELLKNAYYKAEGYTELETLPNIDINIKCGNSLISRFNLNDNHSALPPATQQKLRLATTKYKEQVIIYKSTSDKKTKQNTEKEITRLKGEFAQIANPNDADYKKLQDKKAELGAAPMLFSREEQEAWKLKTEALAKEVTELENAYNQKLKTLYGNTLEWRFEFPEVLDENGDFIGFDVVIGNPPYGINVGNSEKEYYQKKFTKLPGEIEIYTFFIELSINHILKKKGIFSFITTNTLYYLDKFALIRRNTFLTNKIIELIELEKRVFADAPDIVPAIYLLQKEVGENSLVNLYKSEVTNKVYDLDTFIDFTKNSILQNKILSKKDYVFNLTTNDLMEKLLKKLSCLDQIKNKYKVVYGIKTGNNNLFVSNSIDENHNWKKCASSAKNIKKYTINWQGDYLNVCEELAGLNKINYEQPKILIQYIRKLSMPTRLVCALDPIGEFYPLNNFSFVISEKGYSLKFLLAVLNSNLMNWFFSNTFIDYNIKPKYIEQLPLPNKLGEKNIEKIIEQIIYIKNKGDNETISQEKQIDQLVYRLYGLSPEEIAIVEGA